MGNNAIINKNNLVFMFVPATVEKTRETHAKSPDKRYFKLLESQDKNDRKKTVGPDKKEIVDRQGNHESTK